METEGGVGNSGGDKARTTSHVEETLKPARSVAQVARADGVNANRLFGRKLYRGGQFEVRPTNALIPLRVTDLPMIGACPPKHRSGSLPASLVAPLTPTRRPLPAELPRETQSLEPKETAGPDCGGILNRLGEDVSDVLQYVLARWSDLPPTRVV